MASPRAEEPWSLFEVSNKRVRKSWQTAGGDVMTVTNAKSGTNVAEVAEGVYRIHTPVEMPGGPGAFSFNQYLIVDEDPLLFHTGPRRMFPLVREAVASVMPVDRLRWISFSHVEADECGSLNDWLGAAPRSAPLCGAVAAMVSIGDLADRAPRGLADGESVRLGKRSVRWIDAPHVPHGWECGFLFEETAGTLFCGDLFTQGGKGQTPLVETDIVGPSERMRRGMDYFSHAPNVRPVLMRLAALEPTTLACMHGSAWRGAGALPLRALADVVAPAA
jgi:flavorubredoxin